MTKNTHTDEHSSLNAKLECFGDRLKIAMRDETPYAAHKRTGITESLLRKYISGDSLPNIDRAVELADAFKVNLLWLATGKGEMRNDQDDSSISVTVTANSEHPTKRKDINHGEPPSYEVTRSTTDRRTKEVVTLNPQVLCKIIEEIEKNLNQRDLELPPDRKALLIQFLYEQEMDQRHNIEETTKNFFKLLEK